MILRLLAVLETLFSMMMGDDGSKGIQVAKEKAVIRHKISRLLLQLQGVKKKQLRHKIRLGFMLMN